MKRTADSERATYFGLQVTVINLMQYYSLVRFRERDYIVETADLQFARAKSVA
jgi:hypothetical protein